MPSPSTRLPCLGKSRSSAVTLLTAAGCAALTDPGADVSALIAFKSGLERHFIFLL